MSMLDHYMFSLCWVLLVLLAYIVGFRRGFAKGVRDALIDMICSISPFETPIIDQARLAEDYEGEFTRHKKFVDGLKPPSESITSVFPEQDGPILEETPDAPKRPDTGAN